MIQRDLLLDGSGGGYYTTEDPRDKYLGDDSNVELILCHFSSPEHQLILRKFDDEPELYIEMHLMPLSFWKRLKQAWKYIWGGTSKYGAWDEVITTRDELIEKVNKLYGNIQQEASGKNI